MGSIAQKPEGVIDRFAAEVEQLFGGELISVILFGSAATDEYVPKKSDINFLVVLSQQGITQIGKVQKFVAPWQRRGISPPLFLTKAYITASLDSFPIEFLNMQTAYRVVAGEDVLEKLAFKKEDLRLQCEREMKSDLLKLRQGFIQTRGKTKDLRLLIGQSLVAFTSIFRALFYLQGKAVPKKKQEVLLTTCREFGLDESLFSVLLSVKGYETKLSKELLQSKVERYISEIEKLTGMIDRMKFGQKE